MSGMLKVVCVEVSDEWHLGEQGGDAVARSCVSKGLSKLMEDSPNARNELLVMERTTRRMIVRYDLAAC